MDSLLTHSFPIPNHPICELKAKFRMQYVLALGEFRCFLSKKDGRSKLLIEIWARSIVSKLPNSFFAESEDTTTIQSVLSIKRDGIHFFFLRRIFFFDCLYITSLLDIRYIEYTYLFLQRNCRGFFSKRVLNEIYQNWNISISKKIPPQLVEHRRKNVSFNRESLKRILVVATMSAGKSTLINALIGYRVNAVKTTACTQNLCYLFNKPFNDGIYIRRNNGEQYFCSDIEFAKKDDIFATGLHFNSALSNRKICYIDTPGTNYSGNALHRDITRKAILDNHYDAIIFVVNGLQFDTCDEAKLRDYTIKHTHKPIIFVINQLDYYNPEDDSIQETINKLRKIVGENKYEIIPISALYALLLKIDEKKLSKSEQIQKKRLKSLFEHDYYNMQKYCYSKEKETIINRELDKTGITILESVIYKTLY